MAIEYDSLKALAFAPRERTYGADDAILYALGLGLGSDPMDADELRYVTETDLLVLPSLATVLVQGEPWQPAAGIAMTHVLHGEQRLTLHRPLPAQASVVDARRVSGIVDKGPDSAALIEVTQDIFARGSDEPIATLVNVTFARGLGGFGGPTESLAPPHAVPGTAPDAHVDHRIPPQAALIYRLSGDRNRLHSDPAFAREAGFERPILHGLCTYGIACYAIVKTWCSGAPERLTALDARFTAPVYPGETLRTEMWRDGATVSFRCRVPARAALVIDNGRATLG